MRAAPCAACAAPSREVKSKAAWTVAARSPAPASVCDEKEGCGAAPVVQRFAAAPAPSAPPAAIPASGGQPIGAPVRRALEASFGRSLAHVRLHHDSAAGASARALRAHAYTAGHHIFFAPGQYRPETRAGRWLLAHEVAHVVQQGSRPALSFRLEVAPDGSSAEREASRAADAAVAGRPATISQRGAPALYRFPACAHLLNAEERERVSERSVTDALLPSVRSLGGRVRRELSIPTGSFTPYRSGRQVIGGRAGTGRADVAFAVTAGSALEILEVKRATWGDDGVIGAEQQVLNYVSHGNRERAWLRSLGVTSIRTMPMNRFRPPSPLRVSGGLASVAWCRSGVMAFKGIGEQDPATFSCADMRRVSQAADGVMVRAQDALDRYIDDKAQELRDRIMGESLEQTLNQLLQDPRAQRMLRGLLGAPPGQISLRQLADRLQMELIQLETLVRTTALSFLDRLMTRVRIHLRQRLRQSLERAAMTLCATTAYFTAEELLRQFNRELPRLFGETAVALVPVVAREMLAELVGFLAALLAAAVVMALVIALAIYLLLEALAAGVMAAIAVAISEAWTAAWAAIAANWALLAGGAAAAWRALQQLGRMPQLGPMPQLGFSP